MARSAALAMSAIVVGILSPTPAVAKAKKACLDAHTDGQALRREGKLRAARVQLRVCASQSCPKLVSRDCTEWLTELQKELPTVIVSAQDENGQDAGKVRVLVDGELIAERLDGRALEVDPGNHVFRYEFPSGRVVESRVIIRGTEKDRRLAVALPRASRPAKRKPSSEPATESSGGLPPAVFILGGVGLAALGSFAYFAISGKSRESDLADWCSPNCERDEIDSVRLSYRAADISLGVAVVAFGAATWVALASRDDVGRRAGGRSVGPIANGLGAAVNGSF